MSKELKLKGSVVVTPDLSLKPGARLVREWRGSTHTVVVTENGFEYAGEVFPPKSRTLSPGRIGPDPVSLA